MKTKSDNQYLYHTRDVNIQQLYIQVKYWSSKTRLICSLYTKDVT